jgi:hypothetical protein
VQRVRRLALSKYNVRPDRREEEATDTCLPVTAAIVGSEDLFAECGAPVVLFVQIRGAISAFLAPHRGAGPVSKQLGLHNKGVMTEQMEPLGRNFEIVITVSSFKTRKKQRKCKSRKV